MYSIRGRSLQDIEAGSKSGLFDAGPEPLALEKVDLRQGAHVVAYDGPPHVWGQDSSVVSLKIVGYNTKALRSFPLRSFRTMASQHCRHLYVFCLAARAGVSRQHSGLFLNGLPDRHFPSTAKSPAGRLFVSQRDFPVLIFSMGHRNRHSCGTRSGLLIAASFRT